MTSAIPRRRRGHTYSISTASFSDQLTSREFATFGLSFHQKIQQESSAKVKRIVPSFAHLISFGDKKKRKKENQMRRYRRHPSPLGAVPQALRSINRAKSSFFWWTRKTNKKKKKTMSRRLKDAMAALLVHPPESARELLYYKKEKKRKRAGNYYIYLYIYVSIFFFC